MGRFLRLFIEGLVDIWHRATVLRMFVIIFVTVSLYHMSKDNYSLVEIIAYSFAFLIYFVFVLVFSGVKLDEKQKKI